MSARKPFFRLKEEDMVTTTAAGRGRARDTSFENIGVVADIQEAVKSDEWTAVVRD